MIVCVCKRVSDRTIRETMNQGVTQFSELQARLGLSTCCGRCEAFARDLVSRHASSGNVTVFDPASHQLQFA